MIKRSKGWAILIILVVGYSVLIYLFGFIFGHLQINLLFFFLFSGTSLHWFKSAYTINNRVLSTGGTGEAPSPKKKVFPEKN